MFKKNLGFPFRNKFLFLLILMSTNVIFSAEQVNNTKLTSANISDEFDPSLYFYTRSDTFFTRGNIAFDRCFLDLPKGFLIGGAASINLVMIPKNMKFAVDNFWATLGIYVGGDFNFSKALTWRLYPLYHVSAHLGDGHQDTITPHKTVAVSSEMVKLQLDYKLNESIFLQGAIGAFYHTTRPLENYLFDNSINLLYKIPIEPIQPFVKITYDHIVEKKVRHGITLASGVEFTSFKTLISLSLLYINRPYRGYYTTSQDQAFGIILHLKPFSSCP